MELYKRGQRWYADFTVRGERNRIATGKTDRREAKEYAEEALRRALEQTPERSKHTLFDVLASWAKAEPRSKNEVNAIAYIFAHYPDRPAEAVTDASLRETFGDKSPATYNRYMNIVRAAIRLAAADGQIRKPPKITRRKVEKSRIRFLSADEWTRLRAELPDHLRSMAEFTLATGLRKANVLGLEWSQIDQARRVAWIHPDQAKAGRVISVPLNDEALAILLAQRGKHRSYVFVWNGRPITTISAGAIIDPKTGLKKYRGAWGKALARAGIENFRWHDLRHTWASWHVMAGTPLAVLKELGGWESIEMVQVYAHLAPDHVASYASNVRPPASQNTSQAA